MSTVHGHSTTPACVQIRASLLPIGRHLTSSPLSYGNESRERTMRTKAAPSLPPPPAFPVEPIVPSFDVFAAVSWHASAWFGWPSSWRASMRAEGCSLLTYPRRDRWQAVCRWLQLQLQRSSSIQQRTSPGELLEREALLSLSDKTGMPWSSRKTLPCNLRKIRAILKNCLQI